MGKAIRSINEFESFEDPINLNIKTKCPEKWLLIDRETGQVYIGNPGGYWDRLDPIIKEIE